jgi:hypothetical protein
MAGVDVAQTDLFGASPIRCEYYPVLLPDSTGLVEINEIYELLVEHGVKASQLTKLSHVSIDGVVCPEDDNRITELIRQFLNTQQPLQIEFSGLGYYPGRGGLTLKLGIANSDEIKDFNQKFMNTIGGKVTKLDLHLTLARYVSPELWEKLKDIDIKLQRCQCNSVAIYKKEHKAKGAYQVIGKVNFGETNF